MNLFIRQYECYKFRPWIVSSHFAYPTIKIKKKYLSLLAINFFLHFDSHSFPIQNNFMPSHTMYNMVVLNLIDGNVNEIIRKQFDINIRPNFIFCFRLLNRFSSFILRCKKRDRVWFFKELHCFLHYSLFIQNSLFAILRYFFRA